jgi:hypothetical protein
MKKILITLALVATTAASFAQGKITIGNDGTHLITDGTAPISQAGGWNNLTMQLWGGTAAGSLSLQTSFVGAAIGNPAFADGRIANTSFTLTGVPAGPAFLQLRFMDTATMGTALSGQTDVFSVTAGSFAPNSIVLGPPGGTSTWQAGNVAVTAVPEPTSMVLAGLGAASLLLFRRRK